LTSEHVQVPGCSIQEDGSWVAHAEAAQMQTDGHWSPLGMQSEGSGFMHGCRPSSIPRSCMARKCEEGPRPRRSRTRCQRL
jgi:hypothetical protein